jgi:hypothetical protein
LERSGVVVNSQTVADQDAAEIFSENVVEQITSTALSNDIEGKLGISENPEPPARAGAFVILESIAYFALLDGAA